jgi:hypothetical protein
MDNSELRGLLAKLDEHSDGDYLSRLANGACIASDCAAYLREHGARILADSETYTKAMNEISCCDDVVLSNGLTAAIADLREQRDSMWRDLAKLRAEIAGAPVVPITRQVDFTGGIPISWDDHRFETTFAKLLPCDADGTLLRLPAGEPGEAA